MQRLIDEDEERQIKERGRAAVQSAIVFELHPETLRLFGIAAFWAMSIFAVTMTKLFVSADIANSPLVGMFGYNNICVYWDYSPSRELTAMFYPLVEVPLIAYIVLQCLQVVRDHRRDIVPTWFLRFVYVITPIQLLLMLWFRMIFVVDAFVDVKGHTAGFLGLQVAMCLIALQNLLYQKLHGYALPFPSWVWDAYMGLLVVVTATKMTHTLLLFFAEGGSFIDVTTAGGAKLAKMIDVAWMLLAAVVPIGLAELQRRSEPGLTFRIA